MLQKTSLFEKKICSKNVSCTAFTETVLFSPIPQKTNTQKTEFLMLLLLFLNKAKIGRETRPEMF